MAKDIPRVGDLRRKSEVSDDEIVVRDKSGHRIATATGAVNGQDHVNWVPPFSELF